MGNGTIYSPLHSERGGGEALERDGGEAFGGIVEATFSAILDLCH